MEPSSKEAIRRILGERPRKIITDPSLTSAGVLFLLYPKGKEICVLLNKRTDRVRHHKGEISFPGGQRDERDATLRDTALREAKEEMGIRPEDVELLGELDDVSTSSRFLISTQVGTVPCPYKFRPNHAEVSEILEVPIMSLMTGSAFRDEVRIVNGEPSMSPSYSHRGHMIFGATARLLNMFLELLKAAPDKELLWTTPWPQN